MVFKAGGDGADRQPMNIEYESVAFQMWMYGDVVVLFLPFLTGNWSKYIFFIRLGA